MQELLEAAVELRLGDDLVHLGADPRNFGEAAIVDALRGRGIERRKETHERGVVIPAVRHLARTQRLAGIRDVTFAHELEDLGVGRDHAIFENAHGLAAELVLLFGAQAARHRNERHVKRMLLGRPGYLRFERRKDVLHDGLRLRESRIETGLHVGDVLLEVAGQRGEPLEVVAIVAGIVERGR
jgi:hypothetical protein